MIHSIFDAILLYPRFNSKYYSIQKKNLLIQFKRLFNSIVRGSLILVEWDNCPKIAQKVSKIDKKGGFSSKMANIDSKYDSFIHFTIKFNSKDYSISFFSGIFNSKKYSIIFFPGKFNSKIDSKFLIWLDSIQ